MILEKSKFTKGILSFKSSYTITHKCLKKVLKFKTLKPISQKRTIWFNWFCLTTTNISWLFSIPEKYVPNMGPPLTSLQLPGFNCPNIISLLPSAISTTKFLYLCVIMVQPRTEPPSSFVAKVIGVGSGNQRVFSVPLDHPPSTFCLGPFQPHNSSGIYGTALAFRAREFLRDSSGEREQEALIASRADT